MLSPRWRKVIRDIWDNKARTALVVLAIAVGVFAFAGVFITQQVLIDDMGTGYRATNPASITLGIGGFDEGLVRAVRSLREVEDAQGRAAYPVRLVNGERAYNLDLYAVGNYRQMRINRITSEQGVWPPARRDVLLERTAVELIGAELGDTITVEMADGEQRDLTLAGVVHDYNAIPAGMWPQLTGYVTLGTLEWLGHPGTYSQLQIVPAGGLTDVAEVEVVAERIKQRVEAYGYAVGPVTAEEPGKHWGADTTRTFTTILAAIGLFSLVLSGFLVFNTITAVLAQQRQQIGMMKAVGATGGQVTGVFLMMVAVYGVLAFFVALPMGLLMAYGSTVAVARFLNINIINFHLPLWVLALEVVTALIAPLAAALVPVLAGTRITVREAISDYGIALKARQSLVDRLLSRVRGLPRPVLLSLRNTFRRKGRLALTLGTLSLAGAIFIGVISVRVSLMHELDEVLRLYNYDVQLILNDAYPVSTLQREAARVPGVTGAEGWAAAQAQRIRPDGTRGATFQMLGPPIGSLFVDPPMLAGRWLAPGDRNALVVGSGLTRVEPDVQIGDTIVLEIDGVKREWVVVGEVSMIGEAVAYADFTQMSSVLGNPGRAFALFVRTEQHDAASQQAAADALEERLRRAGVGVGQSITMSTITGANVSQFNFLIIFLLVSAVFMAVVGGLGLASTMSLNVLERTREIGVMRATGAGNGTVRSIVIAEGALIGLLSWLLGAVLAAPASLGLNTMVGLAFFERPMAFSYSVPGLLIWLAIVLLIAVFASLMPARRAASISVREALAYE